MSSPVNDPLHQRLGYAVHYRICTGDTTMLAFEMDHDTTELLSLGDFRPAFRLRQASLDGLGVHALTALATFWESCLVAERGGAMEADRPSFRYPAAYESVFDGAAGNATVAFPDLPFGLQRLIGGRAADIWYAWSEFPASATLSTDIQQLVQSRWTRRNVRVRDLAPAVLTHWGVTYVWPCGTNGAAGFGLPPFEYTGGYTALMKRGRFNAPVIFLNGEIHTHAVGYLLALLRFVPDATVRVLEGNTLLNSGVTVPIAPRGDRSTDGAAREVPFVPGGGECSFGATGRVDRWVLDGRADLVVSTWDALGMAIGGIAHDAAVHALREVTLSARLPYVDAGTAAAVPASARLSWQPPVGAGHPTQSRLIPFRRLLSGVLGRVRQSQVDRRVAAWVMEGNQVDRERLRTTPLKAFLPELGEIVQ